MSDNLFQCMGCMKNISEDDICPYCGYDNSIQTPSPYLSAGTILQDRYVVGRVLSFNGESTNYLAYDIFNKATAIVREFLPQNLLSRDIGETRVAVIPGCEQSYRECVIAFLKNVRSIARLRDLSVIIPIYDIFQENNTAYAVSENVEYITLSAFIEQNGGIISWKTARPLLMPVINAMKSISLTGMTHLGISPETLVITREGKIKLTGFAISQVRQIETDLIPEIYDGCAAFEQYAHNMPVGEYTDVYAMGAICYYLLTGVLPKDARRRRQDNRLLIPTSVLETVPKHVVVALANAMQVSPTERTQTFERFRDELTAAPTVTQMVSEVSNVPQNNAAYNQNSYRKKRKSGVPRFIYGLVSFIISLVLFCIIGLSYMSLSDKASNETSSDITSNVSSELTSDVSSEESEDPDLISVPNLRGIEFKKATQDNQEFRIFQSISVFDNDIAKGCIISQAPEAGEKIKRGSAITVVVSKGSDTRKLPSISGKSLEDVQVLLAEDGFVVIVEEVNSSTVSSGIVIGYKSNSVGESLSYGASVVIQVSKG